MYCKTSFNAFDKKYEFILNTDDIQRNYIDEIYGYFVVEKDGCHFGVKIWKNNDGSFSEKGKVYCFNDHGLLNEEHDITFGVATNIDRAVDFLRNNISRKDIEDEWEWIEQDRCSLSYKMRDKIVDLMDEFTTDNELKEDWWQELFDEQDIFEML